MRKYKRVKCNICGYEIGIGQLNNHQKKCDGIGPKEIKKEKLKDFLLNFDLRLDAYRTYLLLHVQKQSESESEIINKCLNNFVNLANDACSGKHNGDCVWLMLA